MAAAVPKWQGCKHDRRAKASWSAHAQAMSACLKVDHDSKSGASQRKRPPFDCANHYHKLFGKAPQYPLAPKHSGLFVFLGECELCVNDALGNVRRGSPLGPATQLTR
jgi:hypothetical protein